MEIRNFFASDSHYKQQTELTSKYAKLRAIDSRYCWICCCIICSATPIPSSREAGAGAGIVQLQERRAGLGGGAGLPDPVVLGIGAVVPDGVVNVVRELPVKVVIV